MLVFRLSRLKYANSLSGYGASVRGARWNSKGVEMLYWETNRSLAMAEVLVHFVSGSIPDDYMMITIEIPDYVVVKVLEQHDCFKHQLRKSNW